MPLLSPLPSGPKVLLFGSQALNFTAESFDQLRITLASSPELEWTLTAIAELATYWGSLAKSVPALRLFPGEKHLQNLNGWLNGGDKVPPASFPLPNIILTPLVVITQLAQYFRFLEASGLISSSSSQEGPKELLIDLFKHDTEAIGLCSGLLTALAVSSSSTLKDLEKYGTVAIRLAMLTGALVDAQDSACDSKDRSTSLTVAWRTEGSANDIEKIIGRHPSAYVSVLFDEKRVTVTTSKEDAPHLIQELRAAGTIVAEVGLRGRFHTSEHREGVEALVSFCDRHEAFQFPDASQAAFPIRLSPTQKNAEGMKLHEVALRAILMEQSKWYQTLLESQASRKASSESFIFSFGTERSVPPTLTNTFGSSVNYMTDLGLMEPGHLRTLSGSDLNTFRPKLNDLGYEDSIAVVGMSCLVPGASDLDEFWTLLCNGQSQHVQVPEDRFTFETAWRENSNKQKWFGNFIQDYDTFDHKFFKKSPREMSSTDPQHRLILQVAYQAVEQSGYFQKPDIDKHIGCYMGVGLVDYENNIACHPANAYSATGNLKSFAAGRISHYFGWTGPGLTIDTACSSSAVAVHQACRAILTGECSAALASGVNLMTSPEWFQNLAGASFLSPTGQCKPFDARGDGYCRGEGVGAVFLKRLSSAVKDGDQILGIIGSTAVYQNQNCTAITVPNVVSLSDLFSKVTRQAHLEPRQITVVEAHGTGTPVGDPAEYGSVRAVFGGSIRSDTLSLGSVKGLVGHTESASGIVALIKVLLMVNKRFIPPQASFESINPAINATAEDRIEITKKLKPWDVDFRAALINNYGASGSNASMIVTQAPSLHYTNGVLPSISSKLPFWFCGLDDASIQRYASRLRKFLKSASGTASLADLSFQVFRQTNRSLSKALILSASSIDDLEKKLSAFEGNAKGEILAITVQAPRPVVLCFGGQVSKFVGLDKQVYDSIKLFRHHLDECDAVCQSSGYSSIFPGIFQREPIDDIVELQTMLFATQYSCAMTWIDCGINVAAVVGHSFGELTALCVSGALSLQDTLKMIAGRASVIRDKWGPEKGAMIAVEADKDVVEDLLRKAHESCSSEAAPTIACVNGPRSFTVAGTTKAIDNLAYLATTTPEFTKSIKSKKLSVTNAFHSTLVDDIMDDLKKIGQDLKFKEPSILLERATETGAESVQDASNFVAEHMRKPVYFHQALQRLSRRLDACIFLEAGSNSTITSMASRALGSPKTCHFQAVNITAENSMPLLTDVTTSLWKEGLNVTYWAHHSKHMHDYDLVLLPPYQFEKAKHWMELKRPQKAILAEPVQQAPIPEAPKGLWTFMGYQDTNQLTARFRVNTTTKKYEDYLNGHIVVQTAPLCSSVIQLEIVLDALGSLLPAGITKSSLVPQLQSLESHSPLSVDTSRSVWLDVEASEKTSLSWHFKMLSVNASGKGQMTHVSGTIVFLSPQDARLQAEFSKYQRLVGIDRCRKLLESTEPDEVYQGRNLYKPFDEIVEYSQFYKGLHKIVSKGKESAGRVVKKFSSDSWVDPGLFDSFCQVAGIFVNCMVDVPLEEMYISDRIEQWTRSPKLCTSNDWPETFDVLSCNERLNEKEYVCDVFVFDPRDGSLLEVIIGIHYTRLPKETMRKVLRAVCPGARASPASAASQPPVSNGTRVNENQFVSPPAPEPTAKKAAPAPSPKKTKQRSSEGPDISGSLKSLISNLSGLEPEEIKDDSELGDLGIDSLMGMELAREIETKFKCTLDTAELNELTDFHSLVLCVGKTLGISVTDQAEQDEDAEDINGSHSVENGVHTNGVNGTGSASYVNGANGINGTNGVHYTNGVNGTRSSLSSSAILEAFKETKDLTDKFIEDTKLAGYVNNVLPKSTELCIIYILDAFDQLGCSIRQAGPGQTIPRIDYLPRHQQFVDLLYDLLENSARLIDINGSTITRTNIAAPAKSASALLDELVRTTPDFAYDHKLTALTGVKLADCLVGKTDALQLIFGTAEGKEIAAGMYRDSPINLAWIKQMEYLMKTVLSKIQSPEGPIKILEMGAGTGGTTSVMAPIFAAAQIPVEYTVTDISSSLVAGLRKRFKPYSSFMKFKTIDIEGSSPPADLLESQHIIIATNCVHATHSLYTSTGNIRRLLRPDGFLMMLEMTETLPWVDLIFGLVEGWWLFDDGRKHALAHPSVWEKTLHEVGYGHVDWTEGARPESAVQRIIIAMASGPRYERVAPAKPALSKDSTDDLAARQAVVDAYVEKYTRSFSVSSLEETSASRGADAPSPCVLVTGATGSLGSHLVAHMASLPEVRAVICINRVSSHASAFQRQIDALESRGLKITEDAKFKIRVWETDTSKSLLGLSSTDYDFLVENVTDVIHNAWPMSISRPVQGFESQFKVMRNFIDLTHMICARRGSRNFRPSLQFISSIATVGWYPVHTGNYLAPEESMTVESVLATGYGDAKLVCEKMLEFTLNSYPSHFRAMSVRIAQITGNKSSGVWNPVEHFAFIVKSSQTLKALPDLKGTLSWTPVNDVAATLVDLIFSMETPYPIYQIENPSRQPWPEMISLLAEFLDVPDGNIVPFDDWLSRVRQFPPSLAHAENPAQRLAEFLEQHFVRMSCGDLVLDTKHTQEHSQTLRNEGPVERELVAKYISKWKEMGFLHEQSSF